MTQQAYKSGHSAPAIAPLRTLAELGDEGTGRLAETDLTPRSPFSVDPGWYERYWYGDWSPSRWGLLANTVWRLCGEMPRVAETLRSATARTMSGLVQGWRIT
jgi:hypothetical protein